MNLLGKKIAVIVCGGIAAYKTCDLVRELRRAGADVRVGMTRSARQFVTELTFATLSENPVSGDLFEGNEQMGTVHLDLARWADVIVVCPATANLLAKAALGIADDFVSTTLLATRAKIVCCPAMNSAMWEKSVVQENVARLAEMGYVFVAPEFGALATTAEGDGWGRLASVDIVLRQVVVQIHGTLELAGKKVVVTAGATREPLDAVRYLTNYSTGRMGFALAEVASLKGADVTLISGANALTVPPGLQYVEVGTVAELQAAVTDAYRGCDILIMAAAVSDYRPKAVAVGKIKKSEHDLPLTMVRNPDILAELGKVKSPTCVHVGFALETENDVKNATQKLHAKNLDLVVVNNPNQPGAAFAGETNIVSIVSKDGHVDNLPLLSKFDVAESVIARVIAIPSPHVGATAAG